MSKSYTLKMSSDTQAKLAAHNISIEGSMLRSPQFTVQISSILGIAVQSGGGYLQRGWIILGCICFMVISAWTVIGPAIAVFGIVWVISNPPADVVLKTTGGDVVTCRFSTWSPQKDAESLKAALEDALPILKVRP